MKKILFSLGIASFLLIAGFGVSNAITATSNDNTEVVSSTTDNVNGDKEKKDKKKKKGEGCCAGAEKAGCEKKAEGAGCCTKK